MVKADQSGIIKEVCELREVTDVRLRLIHEELLRAGPLYLSPGNQLVAWIQHAVSYFPLDQTEPGSKDLCLLDRGGVLHDVSA